MLLSELVATCDAVASVSSRTAKIAALADLISRLSQGEVEAGVAMLCGQPRQGRIGVGWATVGSMDVPHRSEPMLTILDLDTLIDALRDTTGAGSAGLRETALREFLSRATAEEADFVRRLFVGELRHGALAGIVSDAVAKAAGVPAGLVRRATMFGGDLPRAAGLALAGGADALHAVRLDVLRAVLPMLASTADGVEEAIASTGLASVEWKLDGIRVQVHRKDETVAIYTRNLNDVTDRMPELAALASSFPSSSLVLDGETILLSGDRRPRAFQETMSRVGSAAGSATAVLAAWFFDVLHADGADLVDEPLSTRREVLDRVAGPWRIPGTVTDDAAVAAGVLRDALENGHEGVVVKSIDSPYQAGRRGKAWHKVKPVRTLDLVVIAVEWGHGRRRGTLSNLHLGARDPAGGFVMVGKTFKGLTDEILAWQTTELLSRQTHRSGIVVHVRPELVVEIELDGVQRSPRYPGGVALRFARVKRYRPDKSPEDADTIATVQEMRRS